MKKSVSIINQELVGKFDEPEDSVAPKARMLAHVVFYGERFGDAEFGAEELFDCLNGNRERWDEIITAFDGELTNPPYTPDVFPRMLQFEFITKKGGATPRFTLTNEALKVSNGFKSLANA